MQELDAKVDIVGRSISVKVCALVVGAGITDRNV